MGCGGGVMDRWFGGCGRLSGERDGTGSEQRKEGEACDLEGFHVGSQFSRCGVGVHEIWQGRRYLCAAPIEN